MVYTVHIFNEALVIALQRLGGALLQGLRERLERAVGVAPLHLHPAHRRSQQDVAVVTDAADALLVDFLNLGHRLLQHVQARHLDRRHRRVKADRLGHQLVDRFKVLDHPRELQLRGRDLPIHHRHPEPVLAQRLRQCF